MPTTIYIDNEGNIVGLADDFIDKLDTLGVKHVERVSNIEFDHAMQVWVAKDVYDNEIASDNVRSRVIDKERKYFNKCLEDVFSSAVTA
jgi:hypothetical protein